MPGSGDAVVEQYPDSVATGLSLEEIAADPERVWQSNRAETPRQGQIAAKAAKAARRLRRSGRARSRSLASAAADDPRRPQGGACRRRSSRSSPPWSRRCRAGDEWIHEIKYDGYRAAVRDRGRRGPPDHPQRQGLDGPLRGRWPGAAKLPGAGAILDGEVVVLEPDGTTSFQALQNALAENRQDDLVYFAFDLLYLDGYDLRERHAPRPQGGAARAPRRRAARRGAPRRPRRRAAARSSTARPATSRSRGSSPSAPTSPTTPAATRTGSR